ncbi:hypothetical protein ACLOJK_033950 [Asimina triloba]
MQRIHSDLNLHGIASSDSQTMEDSSQLLSLPSQPPDIRIWFPSYEYESPESDIDDAGHFYEDFSGRNEERPAKRRACQRSDQDSEPKSGHSTLLDTHLPAVNEGLPHPTSILLSKKTGEDYRLAQDVSSHKCNLIPEVGNGNSSVGDEFHQEKTGGDGGHSVSKIRLSSSKDEEVQAKRLQSAFSEAADRSINVVEEEGKAIPNDGFRSTKSKKSATENSGMINASMAIPVQALVANDRKMSGSVVREEVSARENQGWAGRMALLDRTNLHASEMTVTPEIRGRWKCPQKGKPYIGPPLKQLRLECWVRRVD